MTATTTPRFDPGALPGRAIVGLWSTDLDLLDPDPGMLSPDETMRAARFREPHLRDRFIAGRVWLRTMLGSHLGLDPAAVRFRYLELGKPVLHDPGVGIDFSLSHSGAEALLGIGSAWGIGVDLEKRRTGVYDAGSAHLVLSPEEIRWIDGDSDPDSAFLRCWVRKEAYAKAIGTGMERRLVRLTLTGPRRSVHPDGLVVHDLDLGPELIAAVSAPEGSDIVDWGRRTEMETP